MKKYDYTFLQLTLYFEPLLSDENEIIIHLALLYAEVMQILESKRSSVNVFSTYSTISKYFNAKTV